MESAKLIVNCHFYLEAIEGINTENCVILFAEISYSFIFCHPINHRKSECPDDLAHSGSRSSEKHMVQYSNSTQPYHLIDPVVHFVLGDVNLRDSSAFLK